MQHKCILSWKQTENAWDFWQSYFCAFYTQVGDVTILVNNAAVVHGKSLMDSDDDALLKSQHINTMGQFWVRLAEIKAEAVCVQKQGDSS